jgi:hypothetical protein
MTGAIPAGLIVADRAVWPGCLACPSSAGDAADLGEHGRRVVAAPPAGPGDDQHQVGFVGAAPDLGRQRVRVVRLDRAHQRRRAELTAPGGEHQRVGVQDLA